MARETLEKGEGSRQWVGETKRGEERDIWAAAWGTHGVESRAPRLPRPKGTLQGSGRPAVPPQEGTLFPQHAGAALATLAASNLLACPGVGREMAPSKVHSVMCWNMRPVRWERL